MVAVWLGGLQTDRTHACICYDFNSGGKQDAGFGQADHAGDVVVDDSTRAKRLHERKEAAAKRVEDARKREEAEEEFIEREVRRKAHVWC